MRKLFRKYIITYTAELERVFYVENEEEAMAKAKEIENMKLHFEPVDGYSDETRPFMEDNSDTLFLGQLKSMQMDWMHH